MKKILATALLGLCIVAPASAQSIGGSYTVAGLPVGQTYFFAISAFDSSGNESGLSSEVSKSIY